MRAQKNFLLKQSKSIKGKMMDYKYKTDDIVWSIYSDTTDEDADNWVERTEVGFSEEMLWGDRERIAEIPDGIYEVNQRNYHTNRRITLKTKVLVWKGKVDIESSKEAVCEFLNKTNSWHYFIEAVVFGKKEGTLEFTLGS